MAKQAKQTNKNAKNMALLISYNNSKDYVYTFTSELLEYDKALEKAKLLSKK